jgi:hypothetical protein
MAQTIRCAACGKSLDKGAHVVRIEIGQLQNNERLAEGECWGVLHRSCFNRSIESPKAAMEELRRLAKASL